MKSIPTLPRNNRCSLGAISLAAILFLTGVLIGSAGCLPSAKQEVVVYVALDKPFSEPILKDFEKQTGIRVLPKYDVESNKTVGLANEILAQADHQRCDLFWNNEILHTLRLKQAGLLASVPTSQADNFPPEFISTDRDWFGFAARARVLIVNTDLVPDEQDRPTSVLDLADPRWKENCGVARPLFGTTATHAAVLMQVLGRERGRSFWHDVAQNARIEGGNKQVAINVARGRYAFGLTDTDDAIIEIERGAPVVIIFPDQRPEQMGTLLIPNTLALIRGGPNPENAKRLIEFLLQAEIEQRLSAGASAQIPLHREATIRSRIEPAGGIRRLEVDFEQAADDWDDVARYLKQTFAR